MKIKFFLSYVVFGIIYTVLAFIAARFLVPPDSPLHAEPTAMGALILAIAHFCFYHAKKDLVKYQEFPPYFIVMMLAYAAGAIIFLGLSFTEETYGARITLLNAGLSCLLGFIAWFPLSRVK